MSTSTEPAPAQPAVPPPRRRPVMIAVVLGVCMLLFAAVLVVVDAFDKEECRADVGSRTVRLHRSDAVQVAAVAARWSRGPRHVSALASSLTGRKVTGDLSADDAAVLATAFSGRAQDGAFTCSASSAGKAASDKLNGRGLTPRAETVFDDVRKAFGSLPTGGYAPGGVHQGHMKGSAHYEGRAVDIFFRPIDVDNRKRGWALAYYLVANAERLKVATVIFDDMVWTTARSGEGFRHYQVPEGTKGKSKATIAILEHRDHVHVDVPR